MQNDTFNLPDQQRERPERSDARQAEVNGQFNGMANREALNNGETVYDGKSRLSSHETDPRLGLGRAAAELDDNVKTEEWNEHYNMDRKRAITASKYVVNLRKQTSADPERAGLN